MAQKARAVVFLLSFYAPLDAIVAKYALVDAVIWFRRAEDERASASTLRTE